jgi:hypothetical protein
MGKKQEFIEARIKHTTLVYPWQIIVPFLSENQDLYQQTSWYFLYSMILSSTFC